MSRGFRFSVCREFGVERQAAAFAAPETHRQNVGKLVALVEHLHLIAIGHRDGVIANRALAYGLS